MTTTTITFEQVGADFWIVVDGSDPEYAPGGYGSTLHEAAKHLLPPVPEDPGVVYARQVAFVAALADELETAGMLPAYGREVWIAATLSRAEERGESLDRVARELRGEIADRESV